MDRLMQRVWPAIRGLTILVVIVAIAMHLAKPDSGPRLGVVAPDITAPTLSARPFSLEAHRGRVVFLDFWATWCPACRTGLPAVQALHERYANDERVYIATVNTDHGPGRVPAVKAFMGRRNYDFPVLLEGPHKEISLRYIVRSIPTTVIIDAEGKVGWVESGIASTDPVRLTAHFDAALQAVLEGDSP
jgi:thiol-disulfide isomerase/thioredoxin